MAEFVDELRNLFGVVKVVHVKAGPYEIGQPSEGTLIPWVIHETGAQIKQSLVEARKEWVKADKQFRKKPTQRVAGRAK
jgi:hypothetical protein